MKTFLAAAMVLFLAGTAGAADYYAYRASDGRAVLSNVTPPTSARVLARQELRDATEAEIAATEKNNRETERLNVLRDLANNYERLVEANISASAPRPVYQELNQVAVSVGIPNRIPRVRVHPMSR